MEHAIVKRLGAHPLSLLRGMEQMFNHGAFFEQDFTPSCEVTEKDGHYLLSFDLPGVAREDITIEAQEGRLSVKGRRKQGGERYFESTLNLPDGVDPEGIKAVSVDGVLTIALKKAKEAPAHTVPVSADKKESFWGRLLGA